MFKYLKKIEAFYRECAFFWQRFEMFSVLLLLLKGYAWRIRVFFFLWRMFISRPYRIIEQEPLQFIMPTVTDLRH